VVGAAAGYGQPIDGAIVRLRDIPSGRYRVEWRDDVSGRIVATADLPATGGDLTLKVPTFTRHLAGKLFRAP
jgi:hypothetical protein